MNLGFVIILAEQRGLGRAQSYPEIRSMAQRAEQAGFDSIWLYDHLLYRPAREEGRQGAEDITIGIWECWTMLSALAEAIHRVRLGSLVLCNSFRNPAILAKMAATLDEVSGGRFTLGIGAGWNRPEYEAFGLPYDHRVSRLEEALQILRPLIKEGRADFTGKYYQVKDCEIRPRGPSPSGSPILVGGGEPRMLRLVARYADQWNNGYFGGPETFKESQQAMLQACQDVGRDPATLGMTVMAALAYKDLIDEPHFENYLEGSDDELVAALHGYADMGVGEVMIHLVPYTLEAFGRLERVVRKYKDEG